MIEGSLARRYAKALIQLAAEIGAVDSVGQQLAEFVQLCAQGPLLGVMSNPSFTPSERKAVLEQVLPRVSVSPLLSNFLRLVLDKDRFAALPDMAREYGKLADVAANRARATVTTSSPTPPSLQQEIASALSAATGKSVIVELKVDPSLLGGMVAQVGDRVYDASLRTRLEALQVALSTTALG